MIFFSKKKYPHTRQKSNNDCAVACVSSILNKHQIKLDYLTIKNVLNVDLEGVSVHSIVKAFKQMGFASEGLVLKRDNLNVVLNHIELPCIAAVKGADAAHFVVIHSYNDETLLISDPAHHKLMQIGYKTFCDSFLDVLIEVEAKESASAINIIDKNNTGLVKEKILSFLKSQKSLIFLTLIMSVCIMAIGILLSTYFKFAIDYALPERVKMSLRIITLAAIVLIALKGLFEFFRNRLIIKWSTRLEMFLIETYIDKLLNLPSSFFERQEAGELMSRLSDSFSLRDMASNALVTALMDGLLLFVSGWLLYSQNSELFLVSLLLVLLHIAITYYYYDDLNVQNKDCMRNQAIANNGLINMIKSIENIKSLNKMEYVNLKSKVEFSKYVNSTFSLSKTINMSMTFKMFVRGISGIIIIWFGIEQIFLEQMTLGSLLAFNALLTFFVGAVDNLLQLQPMFQKAIVASERYFEVLTIPENKSENQKLSEPIEKIDVSNLSLTYDGNDTVFKNVNFSAKKGERIGIIGESGTGKSSFTKLLSTNEGSYTGTIEINGKNIESFMVSSIKEKICYMQQGNPYFFSGTLEENITLGEVYEEKEIREACELADIWEKIQLQRKGLKMHVFDRGKNLSAGEKQRYALARVLLKKPEIIILDEAFSNIDAKTTAKILNNLRAYKGTLIIVTHKEIANIKCDKIYQFDEFGSVHQLNKEGLQCVERNHLIS